MSNDTNTATKRAENIRKAKELYDTRRADKMARARAQNLATEQRKAAQAALPKNNRM